MLTIKEVISRSFCCDEPASAEQAPLTNAQAYMLRTINALVGINNINVTLRVDLPASVSVDFVASRVQAVVEAYSAFRTIFPSDERGVPYQKLVHSGSFQISVLPATDRTVDEEVRACLHSFLAEPFRLADELPIRCGVITKDGTPAVLAMAFSHLILDRWSLALVRTGLESFFADNNATNLPGVKDWSPIDQGKYEQSDAVKDRTKSRLRYWSDTLKLFPPEMLQFNVERPSSHGHWRNVTIQSSAIQHALMVLGKRHNIPSGTILLAAFAVAITHYLNIKTFAAEVMFSNRIDHITQSAVGQYAQPTPVVMDVSGHDFGALLTQLQARLLRAFGNASVPPHEAEVIFDEVGAKRITACLNIDHPAHSTELQDSSADQLQAALRDARRQNIIEDVNQWDYDWSRIYVESHSPRHILLRMDSRLIPVADAHQMLIGVEAVLVELAMSGSSSIGSMTERFCPQKAGR
jgi:hypothetical protein